MHKKSRESEYQDNCKVEHNDKLEMFSSKAKLSVANSAEIKTSAMISSITNS